MKLLQRGVALALLTTFTLASETALAYEQEMCIRDSSNTATRGPRRCLNTPLHTSANPVALSHPRHRPTDDESRNPVIRKAHTTAKHPQFYRKR